jgi:FtsZ-binding cell division protein ZapB
MKMTQADFDEMIDDMNKTIEIRNIELLELQEEIEELKEEKDTLQEQVYTLEHEYDTMQGEYYHIEELKDCEESEKEEAQNCIVLLELLICNMKYFIQRKDMVALSESIYKCLKIIRDKE